MTDEARIARKQLLIRKLARHVTRHLRRDLAGRMLSDNRLGKRVIELFQLFVSYQLSGLPGWLILYYLFYTAPSAVLACCCHRFCSEQEPLFHPPHP